MGCVLAFYFELGINGLVLGSAASNLLQTLLFLRLVLVVTDWKKTSKEAVERIEAEIKTIKDKE